MHRYAPAALIVIFAGLLPADTLQLRDGRTLNGRLLSASSRQIRFIEEGQTAARNYQVTTVDRITFGPTTSTTTSTGTTRARIGRYTIPADTPIRLRMIDSINSDKTNVGDTYRASVEAPIVVDNRTVVPKGTDATVRIAQVEQGGVIQGSEEIALVLDAITVNGRQYKVDSQNASVASESRGAENAKVIGGGAVLGAIIGAIAGGGKGAAIGAATGAGAGVAVQAIRGQKIEIPSETLLEFRLSQPLYID
jgi:hypothetical protein